MLQLSKTQLSQFHEDGFLIIEKFLDNQLVARLVERVEIYIKQQNKFPYLNSWRNDRAIASVVLSAEIGRLCATLAGWSGVRMGQETMWVNPPGGGKGTVMHQEYLYIRTYFEPPDMMTCWIALDDTIADAGTLEYVRGSHKWPEVSEQVASWVTSGGPYKEGYRWGMEQAAARAGVSDPEIVSVDVPAGGCSIHHWKLWHGAGKNLHPSQIRRSLGIHTLRADVRLQPTASGYVGGATSKTYGYYKRQGETDVEEKLFPILWTKEGYRSPFLADYCEDALETFTL